ncbi:hypothetical protein [Sphingosinicella sp. BN140058]|uniref:hypothetical protein n=1 Tax=Sphingosinicella sp. BN140058 TaxID=1892855 RepID=UPI0010135ACB|nr:hypothetical protein [Sphingosinicella sp. BN140058]QAY78936.1 hypothetical protein ETR14_22135 [Sphingosinicella sp. BN140058]
MRYKIVAAFSASVALAVLIWVGLIQMKLWLFKHAVLGGAIEVAPEGYWLLAAQGVVIVASCFTCVVAIRAMRKGSR